MFTSKWSFSNWVENDVFHILQAAVGFSVSSEKSSHNALPSPLHASEKACKRESRYDFESTKYYQAFFFWKENKISLVYIKLFKV